MSLFNIGFIIFPDLTQLDFSMMGADRAAQSRVVAIGPKIDQNGQRRVTTAESGFRSFDRHHRYGQAR
jgi:hypothetical protein